MRATRSVSPGEAPSANRSTGNAPNSAPPATAVEDVLRKVRRETPAGADLISGSFISFLFVYCSARRARSDFISHAVRKTFPVRLWGRPEKYWIWRKLSSKSAAQLLKPQSSDHR